jgi:hypothetical protein
VETRGLESEGDTINMTPLELRIVYFNFQVVRSYLEILLRRRLD